MATFDYSDVTCCPYLDYIQVRADQYDIIIPPRWARAMTLAVDGKAFFTAEVSGDPSSPYTLVEDDDPNAEFGLHFSDMDPLPTFYIFPVYGPAERSERYGLAGDGATRKVKVIFDVDGENR